MVHEIFRNDMIRKGRITLLPLPPWRGLAGGNGKFCIHTKICLKDPYLDISLLSGFKYHEIYTLLYAEHFEVYCFTDQGRFSIHSKNWLRNKLS